MTIDDLPTANAILNGTSAVLLLAAFVLIKRRQFKAHAWFIVAALVFSTAFLACYLLYHFYAGTTRVDAKFPNVAHGLRLTYKLILFPHLTLAIFMLPLIAISLRFAYKRNWAMHRRIAPWTFGIWLYVSVTGVIIYWLLYHLFPGMQAGALAGVSP